MNQSQRETYLGDGLYASHDGYMVFLRAPRENGDHFVGLEPEVLQSFMQFVERSKGVKITIERNDTLYEKVKEGREI